MKIKLLIAALALAFGSAGYAQTPAPVTRATPAATATPMAKTADVPAAKTKVAVKGTKKGKAKGKAKARTS